MPSANWISICPLSMLIQRRRGAGWNSENSLGSLIWMELPVQVFSVSRMGSSNCSSSMTLFPSLPVYIRKIPIQEAS